MTDDCFEAFGRRWLDNGRTESDYGPFAKTPGSATREEMRAVFLLAGKEGVQEFVGGTCCVWMFSLIDFYSPWCG